MDDKENLLKSINTYPEEDLPRLMLADYLDENGSSDLDKATAEFIRISCKCKTKDKKRQYADEGKWVKNNWQRLVPGLCSQGFRLHKRLGRFVYLKKRRNEPKIIRSYYHWVVLQFWKGFVETANVYRTTDITEVYPHFVKDQPLTRVAADGIPSWGRIIDNNWVAGPHRPCYSVRVDHCKEIFDFVSGHDIENPELYAGDDYDPSGKITVKSFMEGNYHERAKIAVSNAIKAWCFSLPTP